MFPEQERDNEIRVTYSVSRWLTIVDRRLDTDPCYRSALERLEKQLTEKALEIVRL